MLISSISLSNHGLWDGQNEFIYVRNKDTNTVIGRYCKDTKAWDSEWVPKNNINKG